MVYKQREFKFLKYINIMLEKYSSYIVGFNLNCLKIQSWRGSSLSLQRKRYFRNKIKMKNVLFNTSFVFARSQDIPR